MIRNLHLAFCVIVSINTYAQFEIEDYKIKNDLVKSLVFSTEEEWVYNSKACITDWQSGEGECTDNYGKYQITVEGSKKLEVYKNGQPRREITFEKKVINGPIIIYNPKTGKTFAKLVFKTGKLFNASFFNDKGQELDNGGFKDGSGNLNFYRFTGSKLKVVEFKDGQPNGICSYYYSNGSVLATGTYKFGRPDGYWREYNQTGKEVQITKMAMGLVMKTESK